MKLIAQGAEAKIYEKKDSIIKDRIKKNYRAKEIDSKLRRFRTRREVKVLKKLEEINLPCPKVIETDYEQKIEMGLIKGNKVRNILEKEDYKKICREIGEKVRVMHDNGIIHQDLTTSNMIMGKEVVFIDFGLSFFSDRREDKAVDLHLFRQALESKHHKIWEKAFKEFLTGYKTGSELIERLEKVESRGRNKNKG